MLAWENPPLTGLADEGGLDESELEEDGKLEGEEGLDETGLEDEDFGEEEEEEDEYEEYEEFDDDAERRHYHPRRADWDG
jgi:hypothetical protein